MMCSPELLVLRPKPDRIDSRFLYWLTLSEPFKWWAVATSDGVKMPRTDWQEVSNFQLTLPSLDAQRRVSRFLDRECAEVQTLNDEIDGLGHLLDERARVSQSDIACGRSRDDARLRETEIDWLGPIPEDWEVVRLTACARLESGHTPRRSVPELWIGADKPWISLNDVGQLTVNEFVNETVNLISDAGLAASSARMLPTGTVVLSRDATIGRASIMGIPMATSQHFANWVCGPKLDPRYLWLLFTTAMQPYFSSITAGSTIGTIGMPELRQFVIPLPPLEEQKNLVQQAEKVRFTTNEARAALSDQRALLIERRQALITAAVTGQLEVSR
jgi:type I restriction enzyme S subunit